MSCLDSFTESSQWFSPIGFKAITSGPRCILLIWGENRIRTLKFDDISSSVTNNTPYQKLYDYEFEEESTVRTIISTATNTFGLLEDGRIFYFVSFRSVEIIPDLKNIRAICRSDNGFVVIRNASPVDVFIEFYSDRSSNEMLKKYKKIPIGWNEAWTYERTKERSVLCLIRNDKDSPLSKLFTALADSDEVDRYSKIVLFSVNSSLFCIFYENTKDVQSEVIQIRTFLSDIRNIWVFESGILCILLSGEGIIDILYWDSTTGVKEDTVYSGMKDIQAYEVIAEEDCVYLSDGSHCIRITFQPGSKVTWTIDRFELCGIIGLCYLANLQVVLGLCENGIFYKIPHSKLDKSRVWTVPNGDPELSQLKSDLEDLTHRTRDLLGETAKSTAINILTNSEVIRNNCIIVLKFTSNCDYNEKPCIVDRNKEQLYDMQLELNFNQELERIFNSIHLSLTVICRGKESFQEIISIDEDFTKCPRVKIFRDCPRNINTLASDYEVAIQGSINDSEKLLIDIPVLVTYNLNSLIQILEEDPTELMGTWKFTLKSEKRTLMDKILGLLIEYRISSEPFVLAIGRSAIVVNADDHQSTFSSNDQMTLHLLKKLLLLESHNLGIWRVVQFEPMETIALCELSGRHALFGDENVQDTLQEIYKDLRDCVIKLS